MTADNIRKLATQVFASQLAGDGSGVPQRQFGHTRETVSAICLGGWHATAPSAIDKVEESESIRLMHTAIDSGINFFDNAWEYHDGFAEELMGRALAMDGKRDRVFLMTKNCERDYEGSLRNLEDSLRRLQTDRIDLWQFHELTYDNDPDWIFERGAVRAALEAQQSGKVRYIGFTGHKDPRIHAKALAKPFAWDACQMPINAMDAHYRSFLNEVVPLCHARGVAVIGIRTLEQLQFAIDVARRLPMSEEAQAALLDRVQPAAGDGRYETFKSTDEHDAPHHRLQHEFALAKA